ncbi:hypothetical protein COE58_13335 [Bacillus cereus]|nr:hypothetical protein COL13_21110 [Bacillus cereus]PGZ61023.1 hypothetical protein COE58_13335 [Bacillus cereus]
MINLDIEVFSSHEIIDNYYSLYVNCCEEIDGHEFFCQIKQNHRNEYLLLMGYTNRVLTACLRGIKVG